MYLGERDLPCERLLDDGRGHEELTIVAGLALQLFMEGHERNLLVSRAANSAVILSR